MYLYKVWDDKKMYNIKYIYMCILLFDIIKILDLINYYIYFK